MLIGTEHATLNRTTFKALWILVGAKLTQLSKFRIRIFVAIFEFRIIRFVARIGGIYEIRLFFCQFKLKTFSKESKNQSQSNISRKSFHLKQNTFLVEKSMYFELFNKLNDNNKDMKTNKIIIINRSFHCFFSFHFCSFVSSFLSNFLLLFYFMWIMCFVCIF